MKKIYEIPSASLLNLAKEDILVASGEPVIEFDATSGEYWVGAGDDWWGA